MRLSRYAITVSAAALLAASAGGACADAGVRLGGHVAKWVAKGHKVSAADDGQPVRMAAFLGFRNAEALRQLIARQSTPGSADYNHYLTAEQFHQRFSPSARVMAATTSKSPDCLASATRRLPMRPVAPVMAIEVIELRGRFLPQRTLRRRETGR